MEERTVKVISTSLGEVYVTLPEYGINRIWPRKGATMEVDYKKLKEALYHEGVRNMFASGILYIEEMQDKIDLGLEPPEAKNPENIIILSEKEMRVLITASTLDKFEEKLSTVSNSQVEALCGYAVLNKLLPSFEKNSYLKERAGVDVIASIQLLSESEAENRQKTAVVKPKSR